MTETQAAAIADAERRINNGVQQIIARATPPQQTQRARPATINFEWTGGGLPIVAAVDPLTLISAPTTVDPVLVEVPFPARIVWAHLYAGDAAGNPVAVTAAVDVRLTQFLTFGTSVPLYGTGSAPVMMLDSVADVDLTGWQTNLTTTDTLIARLTEFTGLATWVALVLQIRPTEVPIGISPVVDAGGDVYVDADGNPYVFRS